MKPAMDKRTHVVVSYALLCAVAAVLVALTVGPAIEMRRQFRDDLVGDRDAYEKFSATIAAAADATAEIETRAETVDRSAFFGADTNVLAAAELQSRLRGLIDERHGTVSSMSLAQAPEDGLFPPVAVTATLQCSIDCLMALVYALETQSPALFVDELSIQSLHQAGRVLPTRDVELEVRLTVRGYRYVSGVDVEVRS